MLHFTRISFSEGASLISALSLLNARETKWVPYTVDTEADTLTVAYPYNSSYSK